MDGARDRICHFLRPALEQEHRGLVRELLGAEQRGQRGDENQEWKQRHQRRQRDVARDRPAVIVVEGVEGVERDSVCAVHGVPRASGPAIKSPIGADLARGKKGPGKASGL